VALSRSADSNARHLNILEGANSVPFLYQASTGQVATTFTTSPNGDTEVDQLFIQPGTKPIAVTGIWGGGLPSGRGGGCIAFRLRRWTTTASTGGTTITPATRDQGSPAAKASCGAASAGVTSGTGGPLFVGGFMATATSNGRHNAWISAPSFYGSSNGPSGSSTLIELEGSANVSVDLFTASTSPSVPFEALIEFQE
jgi:hypothetical protein